MRRILPIACLLFAPAIPAPSVAGPLGNALGDGAPQLDARLRFEQATQDVAGRADGRALTGRLRLGYASAADRDWMALAEFEGNWPLTDDRDYNSLRNGAGGRAVIADPRGEELNRLWLQYRGLPATTIRLGRQRLVLGNARFVGNVGWRQNEQTFNALHIDHGAAQAFRLRYAWLTGAETVLFTSRPLDAHLLHLDYTGFGERLTVSGYAYLLDFEAADAPDSRTVGVRLSGNQGRFRYAAEYADQGAAADSDGASIEPDAAYWLAELGATLGALTATVGLEHLGGDQDPATAPFSTPLATLHKFQGWADVFLATPPTGIEDRYLQLAASAAGWKLLATYHRFAADAGGAEHGREFDLQLGRRFGSAVNALFKYARYTAAEFGVDTERVWLSLDYVFAGAS